MQSSLSGEELVEPRCNLPPHPDALSDSRTLKIFNPLRDECAGLFAMLLDHGVGAGPEMLFG